MDKLSCGCHSHNGFILSPEGLAQRSSGAVCNGRLDDGEPSPYLDKDGSVSALVEGEGLSVFDDELIDQQYRRFHNGS